MFGNFLRLSHILSHGCVSYCGSLHGVPTRFKVASRRSWEGVAMLTTLFWLLLPVYIYH